MADPLSDLEPDDWRRIRDALRHQGRDLQHRSFAVTSSRRELLWQEMDRCLALAGRIDAVLSQGAGMQRLLQQGSKLTNRFVALIRYSIARFQR